MSEFSVPEAARYAGVTYARLDRWIRQDQLLGRPLAKGKGCGRPRLLSWSDLIFLRSVARLLDAGISYRQVRRAVTALREQTCGDSAPLALLAVGKRVCYVQSHDEVIDILRGGQLVLAAVFTDDVVAELEIRSGRAWPEGMEGRT